MHNPVTTYRFQFNKEFTFGDFEKIIPYLQKLGVVTIYASPIFEATPGSTHGYDVLNANTINPEVGDLEKLLSLSKKLKAQGFKWLQDNVPNHMAFDPRNEWMHDVLEKGRRSVYANYFDVLWSSKHHDGKLMVPFLGSELQEVIANKELQLQLQNGKLVLAYFDAFYPVNFSTYRALLTQIDPALAEDLLNALDELASEEDEKTFTSKSHQFEEQFINALKTPSFEQAIDAVIKKINDNPQQLTRIADEQYYRLAHWQETDQHINFRRFFTVNGLICLNIQDNEVFEHHHQLIRSLVEQGIFQGLRVDHIDGLYDPTKYLQQLRELGGPETFISVEKILEPGEALPEYWPIQGSTGYDFLSIVNNLFTNKNAAARFTQFYQQLVGDNASINRQIHEKKAHILSNHMCGELDNLYELAVELGLINETDIDALEMKNAIGEFLIQAPVYRYYANMFPLVDEEAKAISNIILNIKHEKPDLANAADLLQEVFIDKPHEADETYKANALRFYQRCMQFTGPLMAKGVEDTLMYTYDRFIGHNEVGDAPESFGLSISDFHEAMQERQAKWPYAQNTTSTHDTKRGEDVRARLNVLTDLHDEWLKAAEDWKKQNTSLKNDDAPDANDEYFIYQTMIGAHPMPQQDDDNFKERLQEYLQKALREAKRHSNWTTPNEAYETGTKDFAAALLNNNDFMQSFNSLFEKVVEHGIINSLSQVLLKLTAPGVPDVYQGTELWDLSLVDPDNRRKVDYEQRAKWLNEIDNIDTLNAAAEQLWNERYNGKIKLWLTAMLMNERKRRADVFAKGEYIPLQVEGAYKDHIVAYARRLRNTWYLIAVPLHTAALVKNNGSFKDIDWQDTKIILPAGVPSDWQDVLQDRTGKTSDALKVQELFSNLPFALLRIEKVNERGAGILLHISSLSSPFGIGDLGAEAKYFAQFLNRCRQKYWQLLPLNPTEQGQGHSPYSALSSMAGNPLLISPELLAGDGLLSQQDLEAHCQQNSGKITYAEAEAVKSSLFEIAYQNYREQKPTALQKQFDDFCDEEAKWLEDFALYMVLKKHHNGSPWFQWKDEYKLRKPEALERIKNHEYYEYSKTKWLQFMFSRQWRKLKKYCNKRGIQFIGDMPFYISYDSSDVWSHKHLFAIDEEGKLTGVAGVPPDVFSADGQLWGMPVFNWDAMRESGYAWWIDRLRKNIELCDIVRLDHFRAFAGYYDVPASETTAKNGAWKDGPGADFFNVVKKALGSLPFVAEDLGEITNDVLQLRDEFNLPGMKILQFAFDKNMPLSDYIPHNYKENFLVYTGTHDNNTIRGWYRDLSEDDKKRLNQYTGRNLQEDDIPWVMARLAYSSVARIAILPIQDVLGLDEQARMNMPGSADNNWQWRLLPGQINESAEHQLQEWTWLFNRE